MSEEGEKCQRCGEVGFDRRTLWMAAFYDLSELPIPFEKIDIGEYPHKRPFYTLRVCKDCRGSWMAAIQGWFLRETDRKPSGLGSGIFIRRNGTTVEVSREEWDRLNPGREPYTIKGA